MVPAQRPQSMKFCKVCDCESERYADGRCKSCCSRRYKETYKKNAEYFKERTKKWCMDNPDKKRLMDSKYKSENKDSVRIRHAEWHSQNKAKARSYRHNRRARVRDVGGKLSADLLDKLMTLQLGKCACCRCKLQNIEKHLDHVIPISKGGLNVDSNIQLLCKTCNLRKSIKSPEQFMQSQGFLL